MGKTKMDKKVNRVARQLNRQLTEDVYGSRFQIRQIQKTKGLDNWPYYLYELVDNEQPERNKIIPWTSGFSITTFRPLHMEMNDFIVKSDFWKKYHEQKETIDF